MGDLSDLLYRVDTVKFARERLAFHPDARQAEVLGRRLRRALLNCTRQWGKSTITAAKAVHRAYFEAESLTVVLTPSARQSGGFCGRRQDLHGSWTSVHAETAITRSRCCFRTALVLWACQGRR